MRFLIIQDREDGTCTVIDTQPRKWFAGRHMAIVYARCDSWPIAEDLRKALEATPPHAPLEEDEEPF